MTFWSTARRCARPGRVWGCGRSAGRSDSCASREPPLQDWLDNWQPRGTPCDPMSSRACKPHLNPARFAGVRVPRVDERRVAPPRPTPIGPTSSPASRTTRGKDHPTARSSGPGPGQVWHRVQELAGRARKRLPCGGRIATLDPLPGTAITPSPTSRATAPEQPSATAPPQKHSTNSLLPPIDTAGYALVDR